MLEKIKLRGQKAGELLENEAFKEAVKKTEEEYLKRWKTTGIDKVEEREQLFMAVHALKDITRTLSGFYQEAVYEDSKQSK